MQNYKLDNELKDLSRSVYKGNEQYIPKGYIEISSQKNSKTGFESKVFYNNNNIIIAFRGSDEMKAWTDSNKDMALSNIPAQSVDAKNLYEQTKKEFPNQNIILTGHSLGGSLAQIVGSETGAQTVTFNAFGTGGIIQDPIYTDNITNYGNPNDPVFLSNVDNQIGKTYLTNVSDTQNNGDLVAQKNRDWSYNKDLGFDNHKLENMGDLSKSVEYDKNTPLGNAVLKASVEVDVDENGNEVFTREDIAKMSPEEYQKNELAIMAQLKSSGIPSEKDLQNNQTANQSDTGLSKTSNRSLGGSNSSGDGSSSDDGNWVTINGNHILLDN